MMRLLSAIALASLVAILPAQAHDVWLTLAGAPGAARVLVHYGHPDDRPPALADKVLDLTWISSAGTRQLTRELRVGMAAGAVVAQSNPVEDAAPALVAARYDNGLWVKTADGVYRNASPRMVPDAAETLWSGKYAKALSGPGAPWSRVMQHTLELVPLADPAALKPGATLPVRVLFQGRPLAGAEVERGDGVTALPESAIPRFTSDAEGIARVPIVAPGAQLLVIDHKVVPGAEPMRAGSDLYNATLWFTVAP
jgi:uncharacterized GH25 family protein